MSKRTITRRAFLGAGAGLAAAAACSGASGALDLAMAADADAPACSIERIYTLCGGCTNRCGMHAWVRDGKLWRLEGDPDHPRSRGYLCGRGQGYASIVYAHGRLTEPLKRDPGGAFKKVSWDEALSDIAEKVTAAGPSGLAVFQAGGSAEFFARRFVGALGSANYFNDAAVRDLDVTAVINAIAGTHPIPDIDHTKYVVLLNESTCGGHSPAHTRAFAELLRRGGKTVLVDSRMTAFSSMAGEWVPCRPGAELAFLLGIAGELVRAELYDKAFIEQCASGFHEFAAQMRGYSVEWAAEKTGIPTSTIAGIARSLADAAPACFIDLPRTGTFGCGYANSADTVRMVYLVNAMLGNFNAQGGWIIPDVPEVPEEKLDHQAVKPLATPNTSPIGAAAAPLTESSCLSAMQALKVGDVKVAIFCETNPVRDWPSAPEVAKALERVECVVVCSTMMTETAEVADYVLPLASYLERGDQIAAVASVTSAVALPRPAIGRLHPQARFLDEIFIELGKRCGVGEYFAFTLEDYNRAWAKAAGIDYDLLEDRGLILLPETQVAYGTHPRFTTKSGRIDFSSAVMEDAGLARVPTWTAPKNLPGKGRLRLLVGEQGIQAATRTIGAGMLAWTARQHGLDALWINDAKAAELGIASGDAVVVSSGEIEVEMRVKATPAIHPEAVWAPAHYGCTADVPAAQGFGAAPKQLISLELEPATGAGMMCETCVTIRKAGA